MSKTIDLDPTKTADLEPFEGDERNGFWISPFEVPRKIFLTCRSGSATFTLFNSTMPVARRGLHGRS